MHKARPRDIRMTHQQLANCRHNPPSLAIVAFPRTSGRDSRQSCVITRSGVIRKMEEKKQTLTLEAAARSLY